MKTPNRRGASFDCLSLLVLAAPLLAVVLQRAIANPLQGSQNRPAAANGRVVTDFRQLSWTGSAEVAHL